MFILKLYEVALSSIRFKYFINKVFRNDLFFRMEFSGIIFNIFLNWTSLTFNESEENYFGAAHCLQTTEN